MKWLPNALTILRCVLAFVVGWLVIDIGFGQAVYYNSSCPGAFDPPPVCPQTKLWAGWPFIVFVVAALLDYVDGVAARALNATSAFGAWLDPLADKLLVGITLLAYCISSAWAAVFVIPTVIIIGRDLLVTMLRSHIAGGVPVSQAAKWKTAIAMIAIAGLLLFERPLELNIPLSIADFGSLASIALLYLAAALSLYTAYQYVRAASRSAS